MKQTKEDKAWSIAIRERDNYTCQVCGNKGKVGAHHILPRTIKETRHDLKNGITLCFGCHKVGRGAAHQSALFFSNWLKKNRPKQYKYLMKKLKELFSSEL